MVLKTFNLKQIFFGPTRVQLYYCIIIPANEKVEDLGFLDKIDFVKVIAF